ncbi:plasminogen [Trichomycterus rosablanca]|uniref:plasminogen n=1 Tax=Trichomycterus rosablanca TaxID=2290929 RepID=UPI002F35ED74
MDGHRAKLVFCLFLCLGAFRVRTSTVLDLYTKTEGAWLLSLPKTQYSVKSAEECAQKCNSESAFTCRSFIYNEKDQDCTTLLANSKLSPVLRRMSTALFEKKEYLRECVSGIGTDYRGTISKTKSGRMCQRWESFFPHKPNITPRTHPRADLESNFCRNPDGDKDGPWCYTLDPEKRWETCDIQNCTEECIHCSGEDYRGKVSSTESGYTCQRWDSQKPHNHGYTPSALPEKYLEENFCRNPDGEPRPWCFTTNPNKRWDFCGIPRCTSAPPAIVTQMTCSTGDGNSYRGNIGVTMSGKTCQSWSSQVPHKHNRTPDNYPCKGLDENYCRNPDNERNPWCYTSDPNTRWEYCNVPTCGDEPRPDEPVIAPIEDCYEGDGSSYRGVTSETISGKKCQFWTSMEPHKHTKTPQQFPNGDLRRNLCRNPDGDSAPWCYTTDPSVRWEYCKIERCGSEAKPEIKPEAKPETKPEIPNPTPVEVKDCKIGNGATYRGAISTTALGVACQDWNTMSPHSSSFTTSLYPDRGLESNKCRNPDNDVNGPWCYTKDPAKKWDYCAVPDCEQNTLECGQPAVKPRRCFGRIVGGCVSKAHSWPWQISLRTSSGFHFCGGTLIKPQWVLTAAHCLEKSTRPSAYKVYLGIHTEKATESSKQVRDLSKIILEPTGKDIALLKLDRPVTINDKVLTACLPEKDFIVPSGTECYVTGWGDTQGTGGDGILKETGFPVIDNKICNRPAYLNNRVKDHEMCAGNIEGGSDSCQGDSGGPLVCFAQKSFVLQGVTSWGLGCANAMKPGVYARVSKFIDWIESTTKLN